jgi:SAM-dependent methyltransferase
MTASDRHLDLGCGKFPRNPYGRGELCGIDVRPAPAGLGFDYRVANLSLQPIPYGDGAFASVSAYDFIEHVPRLLATADGRTVFPFVELMNEVWRVLVPGGRFYALTPAYPHLEAFTDPTHVNVITAQTHEYFCGPQPLGRMYGFTGEFKVLRAQWVRALDAYAEMPGLNERHRPRTGLKRLALLWRGFTRRLRGKPDPSGKVHFLWELEAVKPLPSNEPASAG